MGKGKVSPDIQVVTVQHQSGPRGPYPNPEYTGHGVTVAVFDVAPVAINILP